MRVDSSLRDGLEISAHYDPMLAKLIAWGQDRAEALTKLDRALADTVVLGVLTNNEYLRLLLSDSGGRRTVGHNPVARKMDQFTFRTIGPSELALAAQLEYQQLPTPHPWARDGWRAGAHRPIIMHFEVGVLHVQRHGLDPITSIEHAFAPLAPCGSARCEVGRYLSQTVT